MKPAAQDITPPHASPNPISPQKTYDCVMTLAMPATLEESIIEFLRAHPEWFSGFSYMEAQGMGRGAGLSTPLEKVKGRARRHLFTLLIMQDDLAACINALRQEFHSPNMAYWVTPLITFGRLV